jgi:hypothetical protein
VPTVFTKNRERLLEAEEGEATGKIGWPHDNLPGGFEPTFRD